LQTKIISGVDRFLSTIDIQVWIQYQL
jgi:hypothetical protein